MQGGLGGSNLIFLRGEGGLKFMRAFRSSGMGKGGTSAAPKRQKKNCAVLWRCLPVHKKAIPKTAERIFFLCLRTRKKYRYIVKNLKLLYRFLVLEFHRNFRLRSPPPLHKTKFLTPPFLVHIWVRTSINQTINISFLEERKWNVWATKKCGACTKKSCCSISRKGPKLTRNNKKSFYRIHWLVRILYGWITFDPQSAKLIL